MQFSRFVAQAYFFRGRTFGRLSVVLAVLSIGLGVAVMEVALGIVEGFDRALTAKIVGFVSDIEVRPYAGFPDEENPTLLRDPNLEAALLSLPGVASLNPSLAHEGLLQAATGHEGVRLKGVGDGWQPAFFAEALVAGRMPNFNTPEMAREILISNNLANVLGLGVDSSAVLVFYEEGRARFKKTQVVGLYETGLVEFDNHLVLCDIRLLQNLLKLAENEAAAYEVRLLPEAQADLDAVANNIDAITPPGLRSGTVRERYPEIFDWIRLQHQNVFFILILMAIVAVVNMATAILILITERTSGIGLLKALGATDGQVRNVFLWQAFYLVAAGVALGNLLAFGLLAFQQQTELFTLDAESYFVKTIPVAWPWAMFGLVNTAVVGLCLVAMLLPTIVANRISPVRAMRFS